jgi:hypothetical protein
MRALLLPRIPPWRSGASAANPATGQPGRSPSTRRHAGRSTTTTPLGCRSATTRDRIRRLGVRRGVEVGSYRGLPPGYCGDGYYRGQPLPALVTPPGRVAECTRRHSRTRWSAAPEGAAGRPREPRACTRGSASRSRAPPECGSRSSSGRRSGRTAFGTPRRPPLGTAPAHRLRPSTAAGTPSTRLPRLRGGIPGRRRAERGAPPSARRCAPKWRRRGRFCPRRRRYPERPWRQ